MNIFVILCLIMSGSAGWIIGSEWAEQDKDYLVISFGVVIIGISTFLAGVVSNL